MKAVVGAQKLQRASLRQELGRGSRSKEFVRSQRKKNFVVIQRINLDAECGVFKFRPARNDGDFRCEGALILSICASCPNRPRHEDWHNRARDQERSTARPEVLAAGAK